MQLIRPLHIDPEEYVAQSYEKQVAAPEKCPNCFRPRTLWALGYYSRNLSRIGIGALRIFVRRFRCRRCGKTASLLPIFAQPYRFVQNQTIEKYARGDPLADDIVRHLDLLSQYWKRFCLWLPELDRTVGQALGRAPPRDPVKAWRRLLAPHGDLAATTQNLVANFQITPFGRYRCHRPNGPRENG